MWSIGIAATPVKLAQMSKPCRDRFHSLFQKCLKKYNWGAATPSQPLPPLLVGQPTMGAMALGCVSFRCCTTKSMVRKWASSDPKGSSQWWGPLERRLLPSYLVRLSTAKRTLQSFTSLRMCNTKHTVLGSRPVFRNYWILRLAAFGKSPTH